MWLMLSNRFMEQLIKIDILILVQQVRGMV